MTYCPHGTPTTMNCVLCEIGAPATQRSRESQGCDVYGSPTMLFYTENASRKCTICDSPLQSSIHMVNSTNTEIRMGAHKFSTVPQRLDQAIQAAARDLPDGMEITITVERGSGWATVEDDLSDFCYAPDSSGMTLTEQVNDCLAKAKEAKR